MTQFVPDDNLNLPVSHQSTDEMPQNREQLKYLLIGSPKGVKSTIHNLLSLWLWGNNTMESLNANGESR